MDRRGRCAAASTWPPWAGSLQPARGQLGPSADVGPRCLVLLLRSPDVVTLPERLPFVMTSVLVERVQPAAVVLLRIAQLPIASLKAERAATFRLAALTGRGSASSQRRCEPFQRRAFSSLATLNLTAAAREHLV